MRQDGEPTIEEILESIKRVLAREDRGDRLAQIRARPDEPEDGGVHDDVLDLALHDRIAGEGAAHGADAPLVTQGASAGVRGSLDTLAATSAQASAAPPAAGAPSALEPLVRELLRPALGEWLDRNLPAIVERMVAAEIARIVERRG